MTFAPLKESGAKPTFGGHAPSELVEYASSPLYVEMKLYPCGRTDLCITCLIRHLNEDASFPHEIGLFLGYPPSDVKSFMTSSREGVKCTGCWKAYSNLEEAERTFERYKKCTHAYRKEMRKGRSLESLAVDTTGQKRFRAADR